MIAMPLTQSQTVPFTGIRVRYQSAKSPSAVVQAILADVGSTPAPLADIVAQRDSWDDFERAVRPLVGPSGFMLFQIVDHGAWIRKTGIERDVVRLIIGNPLIAITMLRHDVTAGLFAPVELLVTDEDGGSALTYVLPSSLMVVVPNEPLRSAAVALDEKLAAFAAQVTAPSR